MNLFWFLFGYLIGFVTTAVLAGLIMLSYRLPEITEVPWKRDPETGRLHEFGKFKTVHNPDYDRQRAADGADRMRKHYN